MPGSFPAMPGSDRAISSSKKPVFKDDRAKTTLSSSKLVQNEDEKAKTTFSSSKMPQNKDERETGGFPEKNA